MKKYLPWNSIFAKTDRIVEIMILFVSIAIARFVSGKVNLQPWLLSFLLGFLVLVVVYFILAFIYAVVSVELGEVRKKKE